VCSIDCQKVVENEESRKDRGLEELNAHTLDFDEEIKKSSEVVVKSQKLNNELSRLKRMQEEID